MSKYTTSEIRNIALMGHAGAGKTTLIEAILAEAGAIPSAGSTTASNTVCDYSAQEKEWGHSLDVSLVNLDLGGCHLNLLDTPGYSDFQGRSMAVLPAADTVAIVVNAESGIEPMCERMFQAAGKRNKCRMLIVNRIDASGVDLPGLVASLKERFGAECLPLNLPAGGNQKVVDCFFKPSAEEADFFSVEEAHSAIVDQVVEVDEALMELYLEQGEVSPDQLHAPFEQALREGHLIPICFVSAQTGVGVKELLEVFTRLMPNPTEGNLPPFMIGEGENAKPVSFDLDPKGHVVAHVFKVINDPFRGRLGIFRIYQGTVTPDSQLFVGDARKSFKVGHLLSIFGEQRNEMSAGVPGDICAVPRAEDVHFDAVLHDSRNQDNFHLRSIEFPVALCGAALETTKRGEEQKLSDALRTLRSEDPSLRVDRNRVSKETVLWALGELHLRSLLETFGTRFNVSVETRPPAIAYLETITAKAEGHHKHKKQSGGAGQFGEVFLRVEPLPRGEGFEFVNKVVGGAIPSQFIPAVEKGAREVLVQGAIAGYPLEDVRVILYDGKYHSVDSKEIAFITAGKKAFIQAVRDAKPTILEPVVEVRITAPSEAMGDITGDLSNRRGQVNGTEALSAGRIVVNGLVPMVEIDNYGSRLKSMTGGQGSYEIELSHYAPVPPNVQQEMAEKFLAHDED